MKKKERKKSVNKTQMVVEEMNIKISCLSLKSQCTTPKYSENWCQWEKKSDEQKRKGRVEHG
jgi:predicted phosphoadenosine phosphosulfate sulfurtransferase